MNKKILVLAAALWSQSLFGQDLLQQADQALNSGDYKTAISCYQQLLPKYKDNPKNESVALLNLTYACIEYGDYQTAVTSATRAKELLEGLGDKSSEVYIQCFVDLTDAYAQLGDMQKAIKYTLEALDVVSGDPQYFAEFSHKAGSFYLYLNDQVSAKTHLENAHKFYSQYSSQFPDVLQDITKALRNISFNLGDSDKAQQYSQETMSQHKDGVSENTVEYADNLMYLAIANYSNKEYEQAIENGEKAVKVYKKLDTPNIRGYVDVLKMLSASYAATSRPQQSRDASKTLIPLIAQLNGSDSKEYATVLWNYAIQSAKLDDYNSAVTYMQLASGVYLTALGKSDEQYLLSLEQLNSWSLKQRNYGASIMMGNRLIDALGEVGKAKSEMSAQAYSNMSMAYYELADFPNSITCAKEAVKILEAINLRESEDYMNMLQYLSNSYTSLGQVDRAAEYTERLRSMSASNPAYKHTVLKNIGISYKNSAVFDDAISYFNQALDACKETSASPADRIEVMLHLSDCYRGKKEFSKAKIWALDGIDLYKQNSMNDPKLESKLRVVMGDICTEAEEWPDAERYYSDALSLIKQRSGEKSDDYAKCVIKMSKSYRNAGNMLASLKVLDKAYESRRHFSIYSFRDLIMEMAVSNFESHNYKEAYNYYKKAYDIFTDDLQQNFSFLIRSEKESYWEYFKVIYENMLVISMTLNENSDVLKDAYNAVLISKGLLLSSDLDLAKVISESGNPQLISSYEMLKEVNRRIAVERDNMESESKLDSLVKEAKNFEAEVIKMSQQYGDVVQSMKISWQDVRNSLSGNDVAIEFFYTNARFGALVLRHDWDAPKLVELSDHRYITALENPKQNAYNTMDVYNDIWKPLEKYLTPGCKVYFAPAGQLYTTGIEYARISEDKTIMSQKYQVYRVSSTKQITSKSKFSPSKKVALYGGINYNTSLAEMREIRDKNYPGIPNSNSISKNAHMSVFGVDYLPGTKKEAEAVKEYLDSQNYTTMYFTDKQASEESFKSLSGQKVDIIHIATHGFYLNPSEVKTTGDAVLEYSGLLMSGCNKTWKMKEDFDDGIITALDISFLDFMNTDLLILSACETGLGAVTSEGVFGLQRGFKKAGVKSIIMSLWPVFDEATEIMMTSFYDNYVAKGMSKRDAFFDAQQKVRQAKPHPAYWAAFVLLDGE